MNTLKAIRKKHRCWSRFIETRDGERYKEYCKLRNKVKSLTRKAVKNKEIEIAKDVKNNPKKFWQYTKSKIKTRIGISDLIMNKENGVETLTNSDKDKANTLSDFFSSVVTTETTDNYPSLEGINISYNMGTLVIDEEKVKKRLHELNISTSPGPDGLHPRILDARKIYTRPYCKTYEEKYFIFTKTVWFHFWTIDITPVAICIR